MYLGLLHRKCFNVLHLCWTPHLCASTFSSSGLDLLKLIHICRMCGEQRSSGHSTISLWNLHLGSEQVTIKDLVSFCKVVFR